LEAYPGMLVRRDLGIRESYKSDERRRQTTERTSVRRRILAALIEGKQYGTPLVASLALRRKLIDDGSGDSLDAVICATQAHWAWRRRSRNFGLPAEADPLEGWIVSA
jgi:predicted RNase H-like nuclease